MTSNEVAKLAGVSLRMLQWWDEQNLVPVVNHGHRRNYDDVDVWRILAISDMRRRGVTLRDVRRALPLLKRPRPGYLIQIGKDWDYASDARFVLARALGAPAAVTVIELPALTAFPQNDAQHKPVKTRFRTEFSTYGREATL